jgi:lysozyme
MTARSKRIKVGSTIAALGVAVIGAHKGLKLKAYKDVVGIPTVCYGETRGIRMGMKFSKTECDAMLIKGLDEFGARIEQCAPVLADPSKTPEARLVRGFCILDRNDPALLKGAAGSAGAS